MSKQDRQGVRTATDLEQKYKFNERFAELLGIATDAREKVDEVESEIRNEMTEQYSQIFRNAENIRASVNLTEITVDALSGELRTTKEEVAAMQLEADGLTVEIKKIQDDGVKKVTTTTGTFDDEGLTIDKTDSTTKTQVTPDGMSVCSKGYSEDSVVLSATSDGVDATNLHAKTWLIVGGRSRFENYGSDRTGCFWIGG